MVQVLQEQEKFVDTPEKSQTERKAWERGKWREGEREVGGAKKHTNARAHIKRDYFPHGEGVLKDCACWSGEVAGRLVFVVVLVVLVIVFVVHVRNWSLHARAAVVRVV